MEFQHFAHSHKLRFMDVGKDDGYDIKACWLCLDIIYGPAYICQKDVFAIHKSCAELPPQLLKHTFHPHPLRIKFMDLIVCDACRIFSVCTISYRCMSCEFNIHFKCAVAAILNDDENYEIAAKHEGATIHHFSHPHQLTRCKSSFATTTLPGIPVFDVLLEFSRVVKCVACKQRLEGSLIYICLPCYFYIHESCMKEMPRQVERSPFHPHHILLPRPLSLQLDEVEVRCYACWTEVSGLSFYCNECDVDLHVSCAKYRTRAIKHHSHPHYLLQMGQSFTNQGILCDACRSEDCNIDSIFSCRKCHFDVHSTCVPLELPSSFQHKRHTHPLVLTSPFVEDESGDYYCDMCETGRNPELQVYYCQECNYIAHIDCALSEVLEPTNEMLFDPQRKEENSEKMEDEGLELERRVPNEMIQIESFHPHPLTLDGSKQVFVCDGCEELCCDLSYSCKLCSFNLDSRCATKKDQTQKMRKTKSTVNHFSHPHQLTRCKINILQRDPDLDKSCVACRQRLRGIIYACTFCKFFLHEYCLKDMLVEVQSPLHPQHPLLISPYVFHDECQACKENIEHLAFACMACQIGMHYSCAKYQFREIKHDCHVDHHLLHLGKGFLGDASPSCIACDQACKSTLFCCIGCGFYIHLECVPLPSVVKHKRHQHPLVLTTSVVEDDSGEYYCDTCETQRNPEHDVYHCKECNYISHIDCVLAEVEPPEEILRYLTSRPRARS